MTGRGRGRGCSSLPELEASLGRVEEDAVTARGKKKMRKKTKKTKKKRRLTRWHRGPQPEKFLERIDHLDVLEELEIVSQFIVSETGDRIHREARRQRYLRRGDRS